MIESDEWVEGKQTRRWDWGKGADAESESGGEVLDYIVAEESQSTTGEQGARGITFSRESDSWSDPLVAFLWEQTAEEMDESEFPLWVPSHVYDPKRDAKSVRDSKGGDVIRDHEMELEWLNEVGEGCPERPFDAVWTFS